MTRWSNYGTSEGQPGRSRSIRSRGSRPGSCIFEPTRMKKALNHLKKSDTVLAAIIERVGPCRMSFREPTFEALARSIVFQQLSTKAASSIYGRLQEAT